MTNDAHRSPLEDLAEQIAAEARSLGAGRVTFNSTDGFSFAKPDARAVLEVLSHPQSFKYKFQRRDDEGRWIDLSKYAFVRVGGELIAAMRALDLQAIAAARPDELRIAAIRNEREFRGAIRTIASKVTLLPKRRELVDWRDYFDTHADGIDDPHLAYLRATLDLLIMALDHGLVSPHDGDDNAQVLRALESRSVEHVEGPARVAFEMLRGKLWSLQNRTEAALAFAAARAHDADGLIEAFYIDMGALTYFVPDDIDAGVHEVARRVRESFEPVRTTSTSNRLAAVVSVDPNFFRIYGAQLFHFAQQLPAIDVVLVLCCDAEQAEELIATADAYVAQLVALNRSGEIRNVQYYRAPVPDFVGDAKTFYASARFFNAQQLLERYERLYPMDIDLVAEDDPTAYFKRIAHIAFGTSTNHNIASLSPWRRNMAGNVAFNRDVLGTAVLDDLQGYLVHGLAQDAAWMLDQNALTYTIERNASVYTPLDRYNRPFGQPRFRSTWERRYLAEQKRRG